MAMMTDGYRATDGWTSREFAFTPEGLREATEFLMATLHGVGDIVNPNRVDLDNPSGLSDDEKDALEEAICEWRR